MGEVSTAFGPEWTTTPCQLQSTAIEHGGEDGVVEQQQLMLMQLKSHMAIAKVISGLKQGQRQRIFFVLDSISYVNFFKK